jgi:hypothetical protein
MFPIILYHELYVISRWLQSIVWQTIGIDLSYIYIYVINHNKPINQPIPPIQQAQDSRRGSACRGASDIGQRCSTL